MARYLPVTVEGLQEACLQTWVYTWKVPALDRGDKMTQREPPLRPCIQGDNYCRGCTSACVELSRCLSCGAPPNKRCQPWCQEAEADSDA